MLARRHVRVAADVKAVLAKYEALQDIISILGTEELSEEDRLTVRIARGELQRFLDTAILLYRAVHRPSRDAS